MHAPTDHPTTPIAQAAGTVSPGPAAAAAA